MAALKKKAYRSKMCPSALPWQLGKFRKSQCGGEQLILQHFVQQVRIENRQTFEDKNEMRY
jgi:hypothetical protein